MPSHDTYIVVVEFTTPTERAIGPEFTEPQQFERVGSDHYQVGYTVAAQPLRKHTGGPRT